MEINSEVVFSTAHISEEENDILGKGGDILFDDGTYLIYDEYQYGYRILAVTPSGDVNKHLPSVAKLLTYAVEMKCKWLVLDRDANVYPKFFETFDW